MLDCAGRRVSGGVAHDRSMMKSLSLRPLLLAFFAVLAPAMLSKPAGAFDLNRQSLTGSWFKPATAGQGVEIEIYPDLIAPGTGFLQGSWFTYDYVSADGTASQRWYTFSGNVATGQSSATLTLYRNTGGNFAAGPVTSAIPVGSVVFNAADCIHATLTYTFTDGSGRTGTIDLVRLLLNVTCSDNGADTSNTDFAYSGNWYEAVTSGQGIVLELNPTQPLVFLAWYTYVVGGQTNNGQLDNRTDIYVTLASSVGAAHAAAGASRVTAETARPLALTPDLQRKFHDAVVRTMQRRIPGWTPRGIVPAPPVSDR